MPGRDQYTLSGVFTTRDLRSPTGSGAPGPKCAGNSVSSSRSAAATMSESGRPIQSSAGPPSAGPAGRARPFRDRDRPSRPGVRAQITTP